MCLFHQSVGPPMEIANMNAKQKIISSEYCHMCPKAGIETNSFFQRLCVQ